MRVREKSYCILLQNSFHKTNYVISDIITAVTNEDLYFKGDTLVI